MKSRILFTLLLAAGLAACGDDDATGPSAGSFQATISGDVDESFSGMAFFATQNTPEGAAVTLMLQSASGGGRVIAFAYQGDALPGLGTYALLSDTSQTQVGWIGMFATGSGGIDDLFTSTGGALRITKSGSDRLEGTFDFPAATSDLDQTGVREVTVSGSFTAVTGGR